MKDIFQQGVKNILIFMILFYLCFTLTGLAIFALSDNVLLMIIVYLPVPFLIAGKEKLDQYFKQK